MEMHELPVGTRAGDAPTRGPTVQQRPVGPAENPLSKCSKRLAMWDRLGFRVRLAWRDICIGR